MKLNELKGVLTSSMDKIQSAIIFSITERKDIVSGCSVEYAIKNYGEKELLQIQADNDSIVLTIE